MTWFRINGTLDVEIASPAQEREPFRVGGVGTRSASGMLRSAERAQKREWEVPTAPMTDTEVAALMALIGGQVVVTVDGDMFGGLTLSVRMRVMSKTYEATDETPEGHLNLLRIEVREV